MSLITPETVEKLQTTLHAKAKESPSYRFYSLYDKIYRKDMLWTAWRRCLINGGAPGVETFAHIAIMSASDICGGSADCCMPAATQMMVAARTSAAAKVLGFTGRILLEMRVHGSLSRRRSLARAGQRRRRGESPSSPSSARA